jgi:hypothetical protein
MKDMINSTTPEMERAVATGVLTALLAAEERLSLQRDTLAKARAELAIAPAQDIVDVTTHSSARRSPRTLVHCARVSVTGSVVTGPLKFSTDAWTIFPASVSTPGHLWNEGEKCQSAVRRKHWTAHGNGDGYHPPRSESGPPSATRAHISDSPCTGGSMCVDRRGAGYGLNH